MTWWLVVHIVDITMFYPAESGGVRTYLSAKSNWLSQRRGIEHTVIAPGAGSRTARDGHGLIAVPGIRIPGRMGVRIPLSTARAERVLTTLRPDLIEVGDPYQFAWTALRVKRALGVPAIAFYHTDLPRVVQQRFGGAASFAAIAYLRRLYRDFDLVLAPSRAAVQRLHSIGIEQVRHQALGVDTGIFHPMRRSSTLREELGLPDNTRLLVYAGRFTREKKLPLLVDAVEHLGPPYHLLMIGGSMGKRRSSSVTCLPFQTNRELARLLASCDALVHPGDGETFGLIVLEAMASGIPVVGVRSGGVAELIDDSCGVLADPNHTGSLAQGIRRLYARDMAAMGHAARARVSRLYDWQVIMPQFLRQYARVLNAAGGGLIEREASDGWI
ncbi:glycosyltransferase family 4 protein [Lacisediminimonas profundi]|uniref:glycosyltransferase family 4 protein n=1 Tax=Lacisediminimonas profundi TaxID=2603856 RepID=UPI001F4FF437|nr:glycosyltransferase family 1 protein [Lacisediminimonas profundi]